jgi:hypothetical protein
VIAYHEVSRGSLDSTLVHPREVFKAATRYGPSFSQAVARGGQNTDHTERPLRLPFSRTTKFKTCFSSVPVASVAFDARKASI